MKEILKDKFSRRIIVAGVCIFFLMQIYSFYGIQNDLNDYLALYMDEEYQKVLKDYESYVYYVSKEIDDFCEYRDVISIFSVYDYILEAGYISYGDEFDRVEYDYENSYILGTTVPAGSGVCRNLARNLVDVYKNLGYSAEYVSGELFSLGNQKGKSNHAVIYVKDGDIDLLLDPMNDTFYLLDEDGIFKSLMYPHKGFVCKKEFKPTKNLKNTWYEYMMKFNDIKLECFDKSEYFEDYEKNYLNSLETEIKSNLETSKKFTKKRVNK